MHVYRQWLCSNRDKGITSEAMDFDLVCRKTGLDCTFGLVEA